MAKKKALTFNDLNSSCDMWIRDFSEAIDVFSNQTLAAQETFRELQNQRANLALVANTLNKLKYLQQELEYTLNSVESSTREMERIMSGMEPYFTSPLPDLSGYCPCRMIMYQNMESLFVKLKNMGDNLESEKLIEKEPKQGSMNFVDVIVQVLLTDFSNLESIQHKLELLEKEIYKTENLIITELKKHGIILPHQNLLSHLVSSNNSNK